MTQEAGAPVFSWDEAETVDQNEQEDFLSDVTGQAAPLACSLENPECEACQ